MTFSDWTEPVRMLRERVLMPMTGEQQLLAAFIGLDLPPSLPRDVAGATLEEALRPRIWGEPPVEAPPATEKQMDFLHQIAHGELWQRAPMTKRSASTWIEHFLAERTLRRLEELELARGDRLIRKHSFVDRATGELHEWFDEVEVSSIGESGLVYFRGGNGKCAWPTSLTRERA